MADEIVTHEIPSHWRERNRLSPEQSDRLRCLSAVLPVMPDSTVDELIMVAHYVQSGNLPPDAYLNRYMQLQRDVSGDEATWSAT